MSICELDNYELHPSAHCLCGLYDYFFIGNFENFSRTCFVVVYVLIFSVIASSTLVALKQF